MVRENSKYLEEQLDQNVPLPMLAYAWMNLKTGFSVYRVENLYYGLGI